MNGTDNCFGLSFGVQGALLENEAGKIEKHGNLVKMSSVLLFFVDKDGLRACDGFCKCREFNLAHTDGEAS